MIRFFGTALIALAIMAAALYSPLALIDRAAEPAAFQPPASPRATYNFNPGWKFIRDDVAGADQAGVRRLRVGQRQPAAHLERHRHLPRVHQPRRRRPAATISGIGWYRKHFKLPAGAEGRKVFLEFDGLQAGRPLLPQRPAGRQISKTASPPSASTSPSSSSSAAQDNVLAVKVDNSPDYKEEATGTPFQWNAQDFNPNFGGLNRDAWLIVTGKIYQTLPLYENLQTTGVYVYPRGHRPEEKDRGREGGGRGRATRRAIYAAITLSAVVVDADGVVRAQVGRQHLRPRRRPGRNLHRLRPAGRRPFLGRERSLSLPTFIPSSRVNGKVVDVCETQTGFRQTEFKGGAGTGGVWLNGRFVWLTGYAQRAANDWAGLGGAYPDWMHDFTLALVRESNGNYIRWMHVSPQRADVAACDRLGIVEVCPAGDKERHGHRPPVGPARRGHARHHDFYPQQPQHLLLGGGQHHRHARADGADGGPAQEMGPPWRPRHGHRATTITPRPTRP